MNTESVGKHVLKVVPPSLLFMRYMGDVSKDEGTQMSLWIADKTNGTTSLRFIVDISGLGNIAPDARKELAKQRAPVPEGVQNVLVELAFVGATLRTKVLMSVIVAAASVMGSVKMSLQYFPDLDAAAKWAGVDKAVLA